MVDGSEPNCTDLLFVKTILTNVHTHSGKLFTLIQANSSHSFRQTLHTHSGKLLVSMVVWNKILDNLKGQVSQWQSQNMAVFALIFHTGLYIDEVLVLNKIVSSMKY